MPDWYARQDQDGGRVLDVVGEVDPRGHDSHQQDPAESQARRSNPEVEEECDSRYDEKQLERAVKL